MDVGRERAADRHLVGAHLLLREGPGLAVAALADGELVQELRPVHAGLDLDHAAAGVEAEHAVHLARVEQDGVGAEALLAHGVARAGDADRALLAARELERGAQVVHGRRREDLRHQGRGERGVHVVDEHPFDLGLALGLGLRLGLSARSLGQQGAQRGEAQEIASLQGLAVDLKTPDRSTSSRLTRALDRISAAALARGVSFSAAR